MDIHEIDADIAATEARLSDLMRTAESGDDWAEICRIEADELANLKREREQWIEDNGQFGVGA